MHASCRALTWLPATKIVAGTLQTDEIHMSALSTELALLRRGLKCVNMGRESKGGFVCAYNLPIIGFATENFCCLRRFSHAHKMLCLNQGYSPLLGCLFVFNKLIVTDVKSAWPFAELKQG